MLAGIYYGAQYGGSTTAILMNMPGEPSSSVTAIDGYKLARKGRAGPALATAALGSFFAGTVATVVIAVAAPPLARYALKFGPPEYFSLMVMGLICAVALAHGSVIKALGMVILGLLFGLIGRDLFAGVDLTRLSDSQLEDLQSGDQKRIDAVLGVNREAGGAPAVPPSGDGAAPPPAAEIGRAHV